MDWGAITSLESFVDGSASTENVQILVCVTGIGDCVTGNLVTHGGTWLRAEASHSQNNRAVGCVEDVGWLTLM